MAHFETADPTPPFALLTNKRAYALVTACRNEAAFIRDLVSTVVRQTVPPKRWVIIDDNSSDATFELAQTSSRQFPFIDVRRANFGRDRSFSSQVYAQQEGYAALRELDFEFIGFLDADIRLSPDYYEKVLSRLSNDPSLAVAGGLLVDKQGNSFGRQRQKSLSHHVPGGVQFFRRQCYDEIKGYTPIEGGGQDTVAETFCLMRGWKVQSFADIVVYHLRPSEGAPHAHFRAGVRWGEMCYALGYHPLYYGLNTLMRFLVRPSVRLASGQTYGFCRACFHGKDRPVSAEFVEFVRRRQLKKLWNFISHGSGVPCPEAVAAPEGKPEPASALSSPRR